MAEITRTRVGELQRGVFKILLEHPEGVPAKEVLQRMQEVVPPTEFEKSDYATRPGVQRFGKIIRFATIGPVKAGWMIKDKGKWYVTEDGKKAYAKYPDPNHFRMEIIGCITNGAISNLKTWRNQSSMKRMGQQRSKASLKRLVPLKKQKRMLGLKLSATFQP